MSVLSGAVFPYTKYREIYRREQGRAIVWRWAELAEQLEASEHSERGTLTLSTAATAGGCELVPGMAISIQVVRAGCQTRPHAHSWWHLFLVQSGTGTMLLGDSLDATRLSRGDLVLVPAWCEHHFENLVGQDSLVLMSITNLPQQARLSNLLADEPEDCAYRAETIPDETT